MARWGGRIGALPAVAALVLTGCGSSGDAAVDDLVPDAIAESGTLLVATDASFPPAQLRAPIEFQGVQTGEVTGFEVDLVEAVAEELGLEVEWVDVPFDEVLTRVSDAEADVGAAAISVTDERLADYSFVTFFETGTQWAAREPNASGVSPDNACGARVAVQTGTVEADDLAQRSAACEDAGEDSIDIQEFERQDEATSAVLSGGANAFAADAPAVAWSIQQAGGAPSASSSVNTGRLIEVGEEYDVAPYGWAVTDDDLAQALLAGLESVVADGDYSDILEFWGVTDGALDGGDIQVVGAG